MNTGDPQSDELLHLTQRLLESIAAGDWHTYRELCAPDLTAFEPESLGLLVEGLEFHHFYFQLGGLRGPNQTTLCGPRVRVLGDVAVVTYIRLLQQRAEDGTPQTRAFAETRIWQRREGRWQHIHFHRSPVPV
jgi:ketosteroid isomerase-like protein